MSVQDQKVTNQGSNLCGSILEGNSVCSDQEKELKRRAHDLKYQDAS
jgi:hypothetical protein